MSANTMLGMNTSWMTVPGQLLTMQPATHVAME